MAGSVISILEAAQVPRKIRLAFSLYPNPDEHIEYARFLAAAYGANTKLEEYWGFANVLPPGVLQTDETMRFLAQRYRGGAPEGQPLIGTGNALRRARQEVGLGSLITRHLVTDTSLRGLPRQVRETQESYYIQQANAMPQRHIVRLVPEAVAQDRAEAAELAKLPDSFTVIKDADGRVAAMTEEVFPVYEEGRLVSFGNSQTEFHDWDSPKALALYGLHLVLQGRQA